MIICACEFLIMKCRKVFTNSLNFLTFSEDVGECGHIYKKFRLLTNLY